MDQDQQEYAAQVELIERWGHGQFTVTADDSLYYRLSGGYELLITNGKPVGDRYTGLWTVRVFYLGQPLHTIDGLITLSPSDHLDAARAAVVTLKCAGLISAGSVEA